MEDLGPLSMLLSWQTLILALIIATLTSGSKTLIDVLAGGTENRKGKPVLSELVVPAMPMVIGSCLGCVLPIYPDILIEYAAEHSSPIYVIGAAYGFVVSLFSDWLYQRVNRRLNAMSKGA